MEKKLNKQSHHLKIGLELIGWTCRFNHKHAWSMIKTNAVDGYIAILKHSNFYQIHDHTISTCRERIHKNSLVDIANYAK